MLTSPDDDTRNSLMTQMYLIGVTIPVRREMPHRMS